MKRITDMMPVNREKPPFRPSAWVLPLSLFFMGGLLVTLGEFLHLPSLDVAIAQRANRLLGHSATYDLTLTFLTEDPGDFFGFVGFVLLLGWSAYRYRGAHVNLAGVTVYLMLAAMLAAGIYELVDYLSENLNRPTPGAALWPFNQLNPAYDPEVDVVEYDSFPSKRGALYSIPFLLTVLRFRRIDLKLLLFPVVFCSPHVLVGGSWVSDVAGGMVLTWTVLAGLMSSPLYRLFLWAEKTVEEAYEQHILSRRSEWIARSMSRLLHGAKPGAEDAPLPVRKIMDPLKPELSEVLKHEWGLESVQQIGEPHKGKVFRMEDEDHAYAFKLSRTASSKSAGLEAILEQIEALNHEGLLRTPRVLSTRSGHLTGTFGSRAAYLMEWVHGRPIDSANVDEVGQLMRHLARLHLSTETPARSSQAIRARVLHVINGMRRRADIVLAQFSENRSSEERGDSVGLGVKRLAEDAIRAQLMARLSLLYVVESGEEDSLCLCHHDMHPMNCLITPAGELVMLDFDRMALGLGCEDLFSPMKRLVECHQWRFSIFEGVLDQYLAVRPLPRSEIALLLAYLYFPQRAMKGLAKDLAANRRGMAGKYAVRLLREGMLTASMDTLRRKFLQQAVKRYDVPLLGLTFTPVSGEELPAWIDAG